MPTWTNNDGLIIKGGVEEAENAKVYELSEYGGSHVVEIDMNYANLPTVAQNSVTISPSFKLPAGVLIQSVEILNYVDFVGSGATFNLGITDADGGSNVTDVDYLIVDATIAELNAGGVVRLASDGVWSGAGVNILTVEKSLLTWEVNTAAITAGKGVVRIRYSVPQPAASTLGT